LGSTIRKEATVAYFKVLDLLLHAIKQKNSWNASVRTVSLKPEY
jgi:hypothetical protein